MSSLDRNIDLLAGFIHRMLRLADGRRGFDRHTEYDRRSVADAAKRAACVVGRFGHIPVYHGKGIIVGTAVRGGSGKAVTDLKALNTADGKHCFGQVGIQFFKYGIADSGWHACDRTFDDATAGVLVFHTFVQVGLCCFCRSCVRHADRV